MNFKKEIDIGNKKIGDGYPTLIIAEAGVNHNGDIRLALQLVREAKRCGADCIKFQTFRTEQVVTIFAPKAEYQKVTTDPKESQYDMLSKLELNVDTHKMLIDECEKEGILFLSTPYSIEDVDLLDKLGVYAFKVASAMIIEPYFLEHIAKKGKPIVLSTGMATIGEVYEALKVISCTGNSQVILLQCTTNYPSRIEDANLKAMEAMRGAFDVLVGYSDHTQTRTAAIVSIALGAKVIEKHFTLDKSFSGPDQSSSANPDEFRQLVQSIREAEASLGSPIKHPTEIEKRNAIGMRRSLVTIVDISEGEEIKKDMIAVKRPTGGVSPKMLNEIIGRKAARTILRDSLIRMSDIQWR